MHKRIIIALLLIITLLFTSCSKFVFERKVTKSEMVNTNKSNTVKIDKSKKESKIKLSPFYRKIKLRNGYKTLTSESERRMYKAIIAHADDFTDKKASSHKSLYEMKSFTLYGCDLSQRSLAKTVFAVFQDNPQFFWLDEPYSYSIGDDYVTLKLYANMSSPRYKKCLKQINAVVSNLLSKLKKGMSEFERELYFHDYLVKNCKYLDDKTDDKDSYTLYGCLVNQSAVCMGYTSAFQLLLSYAGVNSITVNGANTASGHIWNAVKIEGDWYYTDVTWDDTEDFFMYDNFNITTKQLKKTHKIVPKIDSYNDNQLFESNGLIKSVNLIIPKCTAVKYNYYRYKGYVLDNLYTNNMAEYLSKQAKSKKPYLYICVNTNKLDYNTVYNSLFAEDTFGFADYIKRANLILGKDVLKTSVSVTKKKTLSTITVKLKYN